jgi:hypothetical protein
MQLVPAFFQAERLSVHPVSDESFTYTRRLHGLADLLHVTT